MLDAVYTPLSSLSKAIETKSDKNVLNSYDHVFVSIAIYISDLQNENTTEIIQNEWSFNSLSFRLNTNLL